MLTSLQALLRLATLRWLGVFVCALATLLATTSSASALEPAQTKTRVWGFDFAENNSAGLLQAASPRTHLGNRSSRCEVASGSLLAAEGATQFVNPKFAAQLEQQLAKDGSKSIFKSLRSLEGRLAEHEAKLPNLQYKSSVEREIRAFKDQIDTLKQFIEHNGLQP